MDTNCLEHRLTPSERRQFEEEGYLIVPGALDREHVRRLVAVVDRHHREELAKGWPAHVPIFVRNFIPLDDALVELVDHGRIFPKVWGILGFNVYLYHAHFGVTPPLAGNEAPDGEKKHFHQDSGRVNRELEGSPRPRLSLKVGYFLEGNPAPGNGNFCVVPGSHLENDRPGPIGPDGDPPGAKTIGVEPGTAVLFDRRLWHSKSPNFGEETRKVLFYGYAYRWLRTKDEMTVKHLYPQLDPIRRQLLGDGLSADGFYSPTERDVPLRTWLEQHDPEALARWV
jgi:hypothetical protein